MVIGIGWTVIATRLVFTASFTTAFLKYLIFPNFTLPKFLIFNSSILKPNLYLSVGELEVARYLFSLLPSDEVIHLVFFF